jgi:hypothetical protein
MSLALGLRATIDPCIDKFPLPPELNPDGGVWQHPRHVKLRDLYRADLDHLSNEFHPAVSDS